MHLKKKFFNFFSFLLLMILSLSLLTGCTQEDVELATDVLTAVLETELESESEIPTEEDSSEETILENHQETFEENPAPEVPEETNVTTSVTADGTYTTKEEVAEYLYLYGHLPSNFITKKEAKKLGWVSSEGNLDEVAPGMSIGGDYFGNYEGNLPEVDGRDYYECDIDFDGTYRNAKRIVYSNDGLIYYTEDHYESFELLYGEE